MKIVTWARSQWLEVRLVILLAQDDGLTGVLAIDADSERPGRPHPSRGTLEANRGIETIAQNPLPNPNIKVKRVSCAE